MSAPHSSPPVAVADGEDRDDELVGVCGSVNVRVVVDPLACLCCVVKALLGLRAVTASSRAAPKQLSGASRSITQA